MAARDPIFVAGAGGTGQTSPTEARLAAAGLIAAGSSGAGFRAGAMYGPAPFNVTGTSATSPMTYAVAGGHAVVSRGTALGAYLGANDGSATVNTTAAPGSGSRYDLIYIQFPDVEQGDPNSAAVLGVVQGGAGGSPTVPATPDGALAIATALVPSGTTRTDTGVTIEKIVPYTVARGAPVPVRNQTERDALTGHAGLLAYRMDTKLMNAHDGTGWDNFGAVTVLGQSSPLKLAYGSTVDTTTVNGNINVPTGLSTVLVFVAVNGDAAAHDNLVWSIVPPYSGGTVTVKATLGDTGNPIAGSSVRYNWIAIGTA